MNTDCNQTLRYQKTKNFSTILPIFTDVHPVFKEMMGVKCNNNCQRSLQNPEKR